MVQFFAYNGLVNFAAIIFVCFYILKYHRREKICAISLFMALAVGVWSFGYWLTFSADSYNEALVSARVLTIGSTLIPVAFLNWVMIFLNLSDKHKRVLRFAYLVTLVFLAFGFSKFVVASVGRVGLFPFWPTPGILYHAYIVVSYVGFISYGFFLLWRNYAKKHGFMRKRFLYIFIGLAICAVGGLTNFPAWYGIPLPPFGNVLTALFSLVAAYAVMHYHNYVSDERLLGRM